MAKGRPSARRDPLPGQAPQASGRSLLAWSVLLAALTLAVFLPVRSYPFVNYDDPVYVFDNPHVTGGMSASSVRWALTTPHEGNWHPLTMLSHMLDWELHQDDAGGHHLTSLVLHLANVLLLFFLLVKLSRASLGSGIVGALFAIHPLNVQSVAWVSERKNVLSTTLWLLALMAWTAYRRRPGVLRYLLAAGAFTLGLASKPMLVTLPLTLVLVDVWMIRRGDAAAAGPFGGGGRGLVLEKVPLLGLSALCGLATVWAQASTGAVPIYGIGVRLRNALAAYGWYLVKAVWPVDLSVFYPHPVETLETWKVAGGAGLLAAATALAVWWGRRELPVLLGWAWYVVTLVPVIGILQVGSQAYADRYAYVPLIGVFVAIVWAVSRAVGPPAVRWALVGGASVAVLALAWTSARTLVVWRGSIPLFEHALWVDPDNTIARGNLGTALVEAGRVEEALPHFQAAARLKPDSAPERMNLGNALAMLGRLGDADREYQAALRVNPRDPRARFNLARVLVATGRHAEAMEQLEETLRLDPGHLKARMDLADLLAASGRGKQALGVLRESESIEGGDPGMRQRIAERVRMLEGRGGG